MKRFLLAVVLSAALAMPVSAGEAAGGAVNPAGQETEEQEEKELPNASEKVLVAYDLYNLDEWDVKLVLNGIFARHGRIFADGLLTDYFSQFDWYVPAVSGADFDYSVLSDIERGNITYLQRYQEMFAEDEEEETSAEEGGEAGEEKEEKEPWFIFPDSSHEELTKEDLVGLSAADLRKAVNEIYARHGRKFKSADLNEYFSEKPWYRGIYSPDEFDNGSISSLEYKNINLMEDVRKSLPEGGVVQPEEEPETQPAEIQPVETQPQPVETQPQPAETQPPVVEPTIPAETQTQPAETQAAVPKTVNGFILSGSSAYPLVCSDLLSLDAASLRLAIHEI